MGVFASARGLRAALAASVLVTTAGWAHAASGEACAAARASACVIDLHGAGAPSVSATCSTEPWSRYLRFIEPGKLVDSNKDGWWEAAVELALDPSRECGCARLRIHFADPLYEWSVNIGDSPTNDGHGGDAGTTFHESEMQIHDGVLSVFTASQGRGILGVDRIFESTLPPLDRRHVDIEICDQVLAFDMPGRLEGERRLRWKLDTRNAGLLFALLPRSGAAASPGDRVKDRGLYAGFNRAVRADVTLGRRRIGTGVRRVELTLSP